MSQGPEQVILDEPEMLKGFLGRKYLPPPEKVSHFKNRRIDKLYKTKRAHVIVNPFSGHKKGIEVGDFVAKELSDTKIKVELYKTDELFGSMLFGFVLIRKWLFLSFYNHHS